MTSREVIQGTQKQGVDERVAYTITTTNWGSTPTSPVVRVDDITTGFSSGTNVTTTVMPTNSPTVSGDIITLSLLRALTLSHTYRVEVQFTSAGNLFETYFIVQAEE